MRSKSLNRPPVETELFSEEEKLDKESYLPAYAQLAQILRQRISNETYTPGSRLPSEAALGRSFGVSTMTARQAVGVLVEEGLLRRVQGSGTFVRRLEISTSSFGLDALRNVLLDQEKLEVRILKTAVERAGRPHQKALRLTAQDPVIVVERLIMHLGQPFTFQVGYACFDPESPTVENMLDTQVLTGLFFEGGRSSFMKGELRLLPHTFDAREAEIMGGQPGGTAWKLEHIFFDFADRPAAYGWFIVSPDKMPLITRVGVWNE